MVPLDICQFRLLANLTSGEYLNISTPPLTLFPGGGDVSYFGVVSVNFYNNTSGYSIEEKPV
jgi:hypothetical protein